MFEKIYKSQAPELIRVSQLELAYMNKFSVDFEPECLVKNALSNPPVFVELVSCCFKRDENIGEHVYNRRVSKNLEGKYNSHANKPEEEIVRIPNAVPRIVDDETFNKVQARLNQNKRKVGTYKSKSNYLLSGLIFCGECNFHYQGNSRKGGSGTVYSSYRCGKKQNHKIGCGNSEIEKNRLENFVIEQLQIYLFSDEAINEIVNQVNEYNKRVAKTTETDK